MLGTDALPRRRSHRPGRPPPGPGDLLAGVPRPRVAGHRRARRARRALVVAVVGAALVATTAADRRERAWRPTVDVLVTSTEVAPGTSLDAGAAGVRSVPAALVPARAVTPPPPDGPPPVARRAVGAGEIVVADDVAAPGRTGVAAALGPGRRAVAVPVATAPPLEVGQRVDLRGTAPPGGPSPATGWGTDADAAVAEDAEVLAVAEDGAQVTVAVTDAQAAGVAAAIGAGPLVVLLRG